jgi:molecular chaperone Hsp33
MTLDYSQRFIFEDTDIRGELVHLEHSLQAVMHHHAYPPAVGRLLGEFLAASVLLGSTVKFKGRLVLQVRSEGSIRLLVAECQHDGNIRGIARFSEQLGDESFAQLLSQGTLVITIEPAVGQSYQSLVPLTGVNLAACLEYYFQQSEQLATRIWLAADEQRAGGLLLQQLPSQLVEDAQVRAEQWQHSVILAATTKAVELLGLAAGELLQRLYVQDPIRMLALKPISFSCSCSATRTANALLLLGQAEVEAIFAEEPVVAMACEFCGQQYQFTEDSLAAIVREGEIPH